MPDQVAALEIVSPVGPIRWFFSKDRMKGRGRFPGKPKGRTTKSPGADAAGAVRSESLEGDQ
jgi:hypothetical protein